MAANLESGRGQRWTRTRRAAWGAAAAFLLAPLVAMQFTDEVNWGAGDFLLAAALVASAGLAFEFAAGRSGHRAYRVATGVAVAAAFVLVWANLAVGIIGSEDHPANVLFYAIPGVACVGALFARWRARGMARAMVATALAQVGVAVMALWAGFGFAASATAFFCALWLASAWLFQLAARESARPAGPSSS
jgi:hypothetical protein